MASKLDILGWESKGLRCPDHTISLEMSKNVVYPISLIQMPNGTGKTTTLRLLRAALSGDEHKLGDIDELAKRNNNEGGVGYFFVRCLLDGKPYIFTIDFDFSSKKVYFKTTRPTGQQNGHHVPPEFQKFLRDSFVNFFVFDGELAASLLDKRKTNAQVAIDSLFHLDSIKVLNERVKEYWANVASDVSAKENRGLSRRRNRLAILTERLKALESAQAADKAEYERVLRVLEGLKNKHSETIQRSAKWREKALKAHDDFKNAEEEMKSLSKTLLDSFRNPAVLSVSFSQKLLNLRSGLDKVKLPESAAREFFEELSHENECICGREINPDIADVIRLRASNYLGSEDMNLLNTIKTVIADVVANDANTLPEKIGSKVDELDDTIFKVGVAKNEFDHIKQQAEDDDPNLKQVQETINKHAQLEATLDAKLKMYLDKDDRKNDEDTTGIDVIKRRIKDAENKLSEIEEILILKLRRDILEKIFTKVLADSLSILSKKMMIEANKKMDEIMPYNLLRLDSIDRSLVIKNQSGGSVGETLAIAYSFLSSLFEHSNHKLPFVVDSPAGALDSDVRSKVADAIPKLNHQFIAFTISSEREGFVDILEQKCPGSIQYQSLYRKSLATVRKPKSNEEYHDSSDGRLVLGVDFFNDFQIN